MSCMAIRMAYCLQFACPVFIVNGSTLWYISWEESWRNRHIRDLFEISDLPLLVCAVMWSTVAYRQPLMDGSMACSDGSRRLIDWALAPHRRSQLGESEVIAGDASLVGVHRMEGRSSSDCHGAQGHKGGGPVLLLYITWNPLRLLRYNMAFIEPMHHNKPNITYLLTLRLFLIWNLMMVKGMIWLSLTPSALINPKITYLLWGLSIQVCWYWIMLFFFIIKLHGRKSFRQSCLVMGDDYQKITPRHDMTLHLVMTWSNITWYSVLRQCCNDNGRT